MRARSAPGAWADAIDSLQFGGPVLDHGENLGSEPPDQLLRENRPDPLDQAAAEVPLDSLGGGRRHRLHGGRLELQPMFLVPDPLALRGQPFPAVTEGNDPTTVVSSRCPLVLMRRTQKPFSSLWKVTRSMTPEISSVAGRRSGIAAFMRGIHFPTKGLRLGRSISSLISRVWPASVESWRCMAKRKSKSQTTWTDVKAKLADF